MPTVNEAVETSLTDFAAAAQEGVDTLSLRQTLTFDLYQRHVLPLDGYVFWVKVTPTVPATTQFAVKGSLHVTTINTQDQAANISTNRVTFTAESEINNLNDVDPGTMWIATHPDDGYKIAFSARTGFYKQAGLWHYRGDALYADQQTQIIDDPSKLPSDDTLIVSNSLPIWLFLSLYTPSSPAYGFSNPFELFPSFLVPDDLDPATSKYGAVDIPEDGTVGLTAAPQITANQSSFQLCSDRVRITLYGGTNADAINFVNCVLQYSLDYDILGIMGAIPVPRDAKRTQAEFSILGMKKVIDFEVSYYQEAVAAVARKLITAAKATMLQNV